VRAGRAGPGNPSFPAVPDPDPAAA
jgi:hypothetical protein